MYQILLQSSNHDEIVGVHRIPWREREREHIIMFRKHVTKGTPKTPWHRLEDNINMDLTDIEWETSNCIHLAQDSGQYRYIGFQKGQ